MFCSNCGFELKDKSKFCPNCGKSILNAPVKQESISLVKERQTKLPVIPLIVISILTLALIGGIIGMCFYSQDQYLAVAKNMDGKYGFLDKKGNVKIPFQFEYAESFGDNGLAVIGEKIVEDGDIKYKYGFINTEGETVIPCEYYDSPDNALFEFSEDGIILLGKDTGYGYVDKNGNELTDFKYDFAENFTSNGLAMVAKPVSDSESLYGFINEQGEEIIPCQYYYAESFSENGLAVVFNDTGCGYINEKGEAIISCTYYDARSFGENRWAPVKKQVGEDEYGNPVYKWGYIDENNNVMIDFKFDDAYAFSENGLAQVGISDETGTDEFGNLNCQYGFINESGGFVIPVQYGYASDFLNGSAIVSNDTDMSGGFFFIDKNGKVISKEYDWAGAMDKNGFAFVGIYAGENEDGVDTYKYGCIDKRGVEIISAEYDDIGIIDFPEDNEICFATRKQTGETNEGVQLYKCEFYDKDMDMEFVFDFVEQYSFVDLFVKINK